MLEISDVGIRGIVLSIKNTLSIECPCIHVVKTKALIIEFSLVKNFRKKFLLSQRKFESSLDPISDFPI